MPESLGTVFTGTGPLGRLGPGIRVSRPGPSSPALHGPRVRRRVSRWAGAAGLRYDNGPPHADGRQLPGRPRAVAAVPGFSRGFRSATGAHGHVLPDAGLGRRPAAGMPAIPG